MLTTEMNSPFDGLDKMSIKETLEAINHEDLTVPAVVGRAIPQIEPLIAGIVKRMKKGGRLFYIGAGTSGRLGVLDASECPPTFGVPDDWVIGLIAGGDEAIRKAVEFAEDDLHQAILDIEQHGSNKWDSVIGVAASGTTPYVIGGIRSARRKGLLTGCVVSNYHTPVAAEAEFPVEVVVGPEFVTGSTRMKAGTAQKLVLNMISTTIMIQLGRVKGNKMVDMKLSNTKLIGRGVRMVMSELKVDEKTASRLIQEFGSVRNALDSKKSNS